MTEAKLAGTITRQSVVETLRRRMCRTATHFYNWHPEAQNELIEAVLDCFRTGDVALTTRDVLDAAKEMDCQAEVVGDECYLGGPCVIVCCQLKRALRAAPDLSDPKRETTMERKPNVG
jgi:hypothetical protein